MTASTELSGAIQNRRLKDIPPLLERGADINTTDSYGNTALIIAVIGRDPDLVRYLISKDPDFERTNCTGLTALNIAIGQQRIDMVKLLVNAGAQVSEAFPQFAETRYAWEIARMLQKAFEARRAAAEVIAKEKACHDAILLKQQAMKAKAFIHKQKAMLAP